MSIQRSTLVVCITLVILVLFSPLNFLTDRYSPLTALAQSSAGYSAFVYLPVIRVGDEKQAPSAPEPAAWLSYLNSIRAAAGLPLLSEEKSWSYGGEKHSIYIVKNDKILHTEDANNKWYTKEGYDAARYSNLMASSNVAASDRYAIDMWLQAPFHAVGMLDPELHSAGYGSYREADGNLQMSAALDVLRGLGSLPASVRFPIMWPANGVTIEFTSFSNEYPNPLSSCSGYSAPSGFPITIQVGPGNLIPKVTAHSLTNGATQLESCVFTEATYIHPGKSEQALGRSLLNLRDAVVLIPRKPLVRGQQYTVSITIDGQEYQWSFQVAGNLSHQEAPDLFQSFFMEDGSAEQ